MLTSETILHVSVNRVVLWRESGPGSGLKTSLEMLDPDPYTINTDQYSATSVDEVFVFLEYEGGRPKLF